MGSGLMYEYLKEKLKGGIFVASQIRNNLFLDSLFEEKLDMFEESTSKRYENVMQNFLATTMQVTGSTTFVISSIGLYYNTQISFPIFHLVFMPANLGNSD